MKVKGQLCWDFDKSVIFGVAFLCVMSTELTLISEEQTSPLVPNSDSPC